MIQIKIHEFDEDHGSILVSFADSSSLKHIDNYPKYSFTLADIGAEDLESLKLKLSLAGQPIVDRQNYNENLNLQHPILNQIRSLVGEVFEVSPPSNDVTTPNNIMNDVIMV
jgi:hypothetical protein